MDERIGQPRLTTPDSGQLGVPGMEVEDWRTLRATPLFGALPAEMVARFVGGEPARRYEKGTLLFQQGEPAEAFYVVLEGWVKVARITSDGDEAIVGVFRRGESFAEAAMFLGGRYPANAEVVAPARLIRINGEVVRRQIRRDPGLAFAMLASASHHLKLLVDQIEQIKLLSAPQRIANFLVGLCRAPTGPCEIELPYEKALIAGRLGMKPESFSRAVGQLRKLGVRVEAERVSIADVGRLIDFVERARTGE